MQQHHDGQDIALGLMANHAARDAFIGILFGTGGTSFELRKVKRLSGPHRFCLQSPSDRMSTAYNRAGSPQLPVGKGAQSPGRLSGVSIQPEVQSALEAH